jgi:hypothetical protein
MDLLVGPFKPDGRVALGRSAPSECLRTFVRTAQLGRAWAGSRNGVIRTEIRLSEPNRGLYYKPIFGHRGLLKQTRRGQLWTGSTRRASPTCLQGAAATASVMLKLQHACLRAPPREHSRHHQAAASRITPPPPPRPALLACHANATHTRTRPHLNPHPAGASPRATRCQPPAPPPTSRPTPASRHVPIPHPSYPACDSRPHACERPSTAAAGICRPLAPAHPTPTQLIP